MNKYAKESRRARAEVVKLHACERKRAYDSAEEARCVGQKIYQCRYCGKWHRSASFQTLVNSINKRAKKSG
jgi:hypothetical protein